MSRPKRIDYSETREKVTIQDLGLAVTRSKTHQHSCKVDNVSAPRP